MHDHVERAHRVFRRLDEPGEPDAALKAQGARARAELVERTLARRGVVERPTNDVASDGGVRPQPGQRLQQEVVSLPPGHHGHETDPDDTIRRSRQPGELVEVDGWTLRCEALEVNPVVHG